MTRAKPAIIFDLDGTLVDSAPVIGAVGSALLAEFGAPALDAGETRAFIGEGADVFVSRALAARSVTLDAAGQSAACARFQSLYAASDADENIAFDGVDDALEALLSAGFVLGICTNKPDAPARAVLEARGWSQLFQAVVSGDTAPVRKPDPSAFRFALKGVGQPHGIFVGDSEVDAATAVSAQAPFLLFTQGYAKAPPSALPHVATFDAYPALPELAQRVARGWWGF